jgi:hypothetical protein
MALGPDGREPLVVRASRNRNRRVVAVKIDLDPALAAKSAHATSDSACAFFYRFEARRLDGQIFVKWKP